MLYLYDNYMQSLEEQFPGKDFKISRYDGFKFKDDKEPLQLIVPAENDQYVIALEPAKGKVAIVECVCSTYMTIIITLCAIDKACRC